MGRFWTSFRPFSFAAWHQRRLPHQAGRPGQGKGAWFACATTGKTATRGSILDTQNFFKKENYKLILRSHLHLMKNDLTQVLWQSPL